jgi:hypothetical protein
MFTKPPTRSPFLQGLDDTQHALEVQLHQVEALGGTEAVTRATTPPPLSLTDLDRFLLRLQQMRRWVEEDPALLQAIDAHLRGYVGQQARRQNRRNLAISLSTTGVGAILGWLLSVLLPPTVLGHLLHP